MIIYSTIIKNNDNDSFLVMRGRQQLKCLLNRRSSRQITLDRNYVMGKLEFQLCSDLKFVANDAYKVFSQPKNKAENTL